VKNSTTTDPTDNRQLIPFSRIVNTTYNASQDQYTFGGRLTDHQTCDRHTYAADARRSQRGQKPNSTAALCPTTIRVPLLHCCISKLAVCSQALGALRACGCSAVGALYSEISGTGLQGQVRYGGVLQDLTPGCRKHAHPRPSPRPHPQWYIRCNVY
jgi:hypothetical protein